MLLSKSSIIVPSVRSATQLPGAAAFGCSCAPLPKSQRERNQKILEDFNTEEKLCSFALQSVAAVAIQWKELFLLHQKKILNWKWSSLSSLIILICQPVGPTAAWNQKSPSTIKNVWLCMDFSPAQLRLAQATVRAVWCNRSAQDENTQRQPSEN